MTTPAARPAAPCRSCCRRCRRKGLEDSPIGIPGCLKLLKHRHQRLGRGFPELLLQRSRYGHHRPVELPYASLVSCISDDNVAWRVSGERFKRRRRLVGRRAAQVAGYRERLHNMHSRVHVCMRVRVGRGHRQAR